MIIYDVLNEDRSHYSTANLRSIADILGEKLFSFLGFEKGFK